MSLRDQIIERAREIRTDAYGMSIGEVLTLANDGDIDIHPEFQRIFRWTEGQKSRLIESILLGIPIPPIFVSQREDGVWDVIDGVQRLSTILEFTGNLPGEDGQPKQGFTLDEGEYLTQMTGFQWDSQGRGLEFDAGLKRDFKRAKLDFVIITKGSDSSAKFDLFQRLNSGSVLSAQEARNCLLVMLNREMFLLVQKLSSQAPLTESIQLSERKEEQAYHEELVLRFFAQRDFSGGDAELRQDLGEYLTSWMRGKAMAGGLSPHDEDLFNRSFTLLSTALGEDAFRRFDGSKHTGPFSISGYEFISSGVAANLRKWEAATADELRARVRGAWGDDKFRASSGTGVSARRRFPRLVNRSRDFFS